MPISTQLTRMAQNVGALNADTNAIFEALRAKGVSVPANAQLSDVADMIESILVPPKNAVEIGGRWYPYVQIGNQLWLAENLDYAWVGLDIGGSTTITGNSHAWYYDNDESTYGIDGTYKCGLLYNWYASKYLDDNKSTLLPEGWHVPTDAEFTSLTNEIGGTSIGGTKLKAISKSVTSNWPLTQWDGTDDYGFNALPSGNCSGVFGNFDRSCYYWSITKRMENTAYYRNIQTASNIYRDHTIIDCGMSIRLVKDVT